MDFNKRKNTFINFAELSLDQQLVSIQLSKTLIGNSKIILKKTIRFAQALRNQGDVHHRLQGALFSAAKTQNVRVHRHCGQSELLEAANADQRDLNRRGR